MKKDIETRSDIELLVNRFYEKVLKDDLIGFIFTRERKINWNTHFPIMYDFWENVLFFTGRYSGNPLALHKHIHKQIPLKQEYFDRWIQLFHETVDELFTGINASLIKKRASNISSVMQVKILHSKDLSFGNES